MLAGPDRAQGLEFPEPAVDAGTDKALLRLANCYFSTGDEQSFGRTRKTPGKAALAGNYYSLLRLVLEYKSGISWPRDQVAASDWLKFGARSGSVSMIVEFVYPPETAPGAARSPNQAADYYYLALNRGNYYPVWRASSDWGRETALTVEDPGQSAVSGAD